MEQNSIKLAQRPDAIEEHFPFDEFREYQKEVIEKIITRFEGGKEYVILEAPTGAGKSPIALTVARYFGNAYFLTSQKILQDQYVKDFDLNMLKGKGNYDCRLPKHTHLKCNLAPCSISKLKCPMRGLNGLQERCPYFNALNETLESRVSVLNYHIGLSQKKLHEYPRELVICDEAHNIEAILMDRYSISISAKQLKKLGCNTGILEEMKTYKNKRAFIREIIIPELNRRHKELSAINSNEITLLKNINDMNNYINKMDDFMASEESDNWVFCEKEMTFKPLFIDKKTQDVFKLGFKKLLMSATILDADSYARSMGIPKDKVAVIKMPSTFPKENRPIDLRFARYSLKMADIDESLPKMKNAVAAVLAIHKNEKGIIHTNTYKIADFLVSRLNDDRLFYPKTGTRDEILKAHAATDKPSVLISPSMTEGLDLKDDLSRFQIICKIPYPYLGDKQISERKRLDPEWYMWKTCLTLVQAFGRSVRTRDDWARTYVMDKGFKWFVKQNRHRLPNWFLVSILRDEK